MDPRQGWCDLELEGPRSHWLARSARSGGDKQYRSRTKSQTYARESPVVGIYRAADDHARRRRLQRRKRRKQGVPQSRWETKR
jgi:hypothetical protein